MASGVTDWEGSFVDPINPVDLGLTLFKGIALVTPFIIGVAFLLRARRRLAKWPRAEGTIKGMHQRWTADYDDGPTLDRTISYRFTDSTGTERTGTAPRPDDARWGGTLEVMYDPDDPARNQAVESMTMWYVMVGVFFLLSLPGLWFLAQAARTLT